MNKVNYWTENRKVFLWNAELYLHPFHLSLSDPWSQTKCSLSAVPSLEVDPTSHALIVWDSHFPVWWWRWVSCSLTCCSLVLFAVQLDKLKKRRLHESLMRPDLTSTLHSTSHLTSSSIWKTVFRNWPHLLLLTIKINYFCCYTAQSASWWTET